MRDAPTAGPRQADPAPRFERGPAGAGSGHDVLVVPPGRWVPPLRRELGRGAFALVVVEGLLVRELQVGGDPAMQLVVPGDVIAPREADARPGALLGVTERWRAISTTRLAALGDRFLEEAARRPRLVGQLHERLQRQLRRQSVHLAISQLSRAEDRVLALLRTLCEDHGRVRPDGVVLDLALTHEAIARLVGGRRPTISLAVRNLMAEGQLGRTADRRWLLPASTVLGAQGTAAPAASARAVEDRDVVWSGPAERARHDPSRAERTCQEAAELQAAAAELSEASRRAEVRRRELVDQVERAAEQTRRVRDRVTQTRTVPEPARSTVAGRRAGTEVDAGA